MFVKLTVTSCVDEYSPSVNVTVAVYVDFASKSGAVTAFPLRSVNTAALTKLKTPVDESIVSSVPDTENEIVCRSDASTIPIDLWFSTALKVAVDVKAGAVVSSTVTVLVAVPALPEASVDV